MTDDQDRKRAIENYWLKRLSGDLPGFKLPLSPTGDSGDTGDKVSLNIPVPGTVARLLTEIANNSDAGIFVLFFAGLNLVISRYTGLEDIIIGTVAPRREEIKKDQLLLCRGTVSAGETFRDTFNHIKQHLLEDFNHTDPYSFGILYQRLLEKSGKDTLELFNVGCIYDRLQNRAKQLKQFDLLLTLSSGEESTGLELIVDYNSAVYAPERIRRFCLNLFHVLENLRSLFDQKIADIPILCPEELQDMADFNKTDASYPEGKTLHRLFEEQVERTPDLLAVAGSVTGDVGNQTRMPRLTYRELNEKANRLAHLLRKKGAGPGTIVGILADRSPNTVAHLLAVLKAGAAYLPMDPAMPRNRITTMLADSKASFLLTGGNVIRRLNYSALQGLEERNASIIQASPRRQIVDLDTLPIPDRSLVDYEKYNHYIGQVMVKNIISLQTARGCPYNCAYCSEIWPDKHVFRSAEKIFEELKLYYDMGIRRFSIFDDIFNVNKANGKRLFKLIIENKLDVQLFFPNGMRGDLLDKEYIDLAVEAGLCSTAMALETASPRLQKMIRKNLNLDKFRENIEYFCEKHPHVILELFTMHGFPSETEEEAKMTMDFIKSLKWVHFPYVFILKIYPGTEMADLALQHGVYREDILKSEDLAFHELSPTSPFESSFTRNYQAEFLNKYFLNKERLRHVLPYQARVLTEDEMVQKYDSYLPFEIKSFDHILELAGVNREELRIDGFRKEEEFFVPHLNRKLREYFPPPRSAEDALRVLLLDLSQYFSGDTDMLYDVVEPPLGPMYIATYLKKQLGEAVDVRILKSRIDFDSYDQLKSRLEEFKPDVIGVRTLTFYRDFFHRTIGLIRMWGFEGPIIAGGPYATRNVHTLLQDKNIDLLVTSEGETTFLEVVEKIMAAGKKLPDEAVLKEITGTAHVPRDAAGAREVLLTDTLEEVLALQPVDNPGSTALSSDMAYIIYTSGSTGTPKGVIAEHRNVTNVLDWFARTYDIKPGTHVIQLSSLTFDPSVEQIFSALIGGASVFIGDKELVADKELLTRFVEEHKIHVLNFVPSGLKNLLGENDPLKSLRVVIAGGEKLDQAVKDTLLAKGYNLYNHYGPTESTIEALTDSCSSAPVTLGSPIANTQCYVMSPSGIPVPVGVEGELYIGGAGISRGYLNNPELTAERFIDKRFLGVQGAVFQKSPLAAGGNFYRTGDRVRLLPDGKIEFLGRYDHQVKIRGLRIELGEIESRLERHSGIKQAVVTVRQRTAENAPVDTPGEDCLCAYFVTERAVDSTELREYLALDLPIYMVPDYFVKLDTMPLTAAGKIDRAALPDPWTKEADEAVEYAAPTNEVEELLVKIWQEVLGREKIGIHENFFLIGGDSVKSIHILSSLKSAGYRIEMGDIFQYWSIAQLAPRVEKVSRDIDQSPVTGVVPLVPSQVEFFRNWHPDHRHHFNHAGLLYAEEGVDQPALRYALEKIHAHHDALRMTFKEENGIVDQVNHGLDYPFSFVVVDLRELPAGIGLSDAVRQQAEALQRSLDPAAGPLMKIALLQCPDGERLFIVIHHLVLDAVSWNIILEDLEKLYRYRRENPTGDNPPLLAKTDSFKNWASHVHEYARSPLLLKEKSYWNRVESIDVEPLPTDKQGAALEKDRELSIRKLSEEETSQLLTEANEAFGTEVTELLLTALTLSIREIFGQNRLLVAMEGHGREGFVKDMDISRTVGWFTSLYPVLLEASHGDMARRIIEIKDNLRRLPRKGIGYGILKYLTPDELKQDITFRQAPQVSFNYLGQYDVENQNLSFKFAKESTGDSFHPEARQEYLLDVFSVVSQNRLIMSISYNRTQFEKETIEKLLARYEMQLREIVSFCLQRQGREVTPADMDYKELSVEQLDNIFD